MTRMGGRSTLAAALREGVTVRWMCGSYTGSVYP